MKGCARVYLSYISPTRGPRGFPRGCDGYCSQAKLDLHSPWPGRRLALGAKRATAPRYICLVQFAHFFPIGRARVRALYAALGDSLYSRYFSFFLFCTIVRANRVYSDTDQYRYKSVKVYVQLIRSTSKGV